MITIICSFMNPLHTFAGVTSSRAESPGGGGFTYGGWRCARGRGPLHMESVAPASEPTPCDTFNGNCVLVPAAAMRALDNLDPAFTHSMGDLDLGLRARWACRPRPPSGPG